VPKELTHLKPAIVGTDAQDGLAFAEYDPSGPNTTVGLEWDLVLFSCPATTTVRYRQQNGLVAFRYVYYGNFTNVSPRTWMGAYHGSELPMLMGTHPNYRGNSTPEEYETSFAFQDAYVAFASDPKNGLARHGWKQYMDLGSNEVRAFGKDGVAAQDVSITSTEALCE
jgi:cholinesterase